VIDTRDVSVDDDLLKFEEPGPPHPQWLWVRMRTRSPDHEVWARFFADEAPRDGLDYCPAGPPGSPPAISSVTPAATTPNNSSIAPDIMTVEETAALLRIHTKTAYEKLKRRKIPGGVNFDGVVRVSKAVLLEAFRAGLASTGRRR
jgi:hypothetical protein